MNNETTTNGAAPMQAREKCSFTGCHQPAKFRLTQQMGKRQQTLCCERHAPAWVKTGQQSAFAKRFGAEAHHVEAL